MRGSSVSFVRAETTSGRSWTTYFAEAGRAGCFARRRAASRPWAPPIVDEQRRRAQVSAPPMILDVPYTSVQSISWFRKGAISPMKLAPAEGLP